MRESGSIIFFTRNFGFIRADRGGKDVFISASALARAGIATITAGDRVSFRAVENERGISAHDVQLETENEEA